jgi:hypothetical protein
MILFDFDKNKIKIRKLKTNKVFFIFLYHYFSHYIYGPEKN